MLPYSNISHTCAFSEYYIAKSPENKFTIEQLKSDAAEGKSVIINGTKMLARRGTIICVCLNVQEYFITD